MPQYFLSMKFRYEYTDAATVVVITNNQTKLTKTTNGKQFFRLAKHTIQSFIYIILFVCFRWSVCWFSFSLSHTCRMSIFAQIFINLKAPRRNCRKLFFSFDIQENFCFLTNLNFKMLNELILIGFVYSFKSHFYDSFIL